MHSNFTSGEGSNFDDWQQRMLRPVWQSKETTFFFPLPTPLLELLVGLLIYDCYKLSKVCDHNEAVSVSPKGSSHVQFLVTLGF